MSGTKAVPRQNLTAAHARRDTASQYGFWVYLMTDLMVFATLFATYAVLRSRTFGGPAGRDIFDMTFVLAETMLLLTSSFTIGLAMMAAHEGNQQRAFRLVILTLLLGAAFLGMELYEFNHLVAEGFSWRRSAFLSAFFTLVGTHGLHIAIGLIWSVVMAVQIKRNGLAPGVTRRLGLFSMFWHFLDIVWIFIFTFVYLLGAIK